MKDFLLIWGIGGPVSVAFLILYWFLLFRKYKELKIDVEDLVMLFVVFLLGPLSLIWILMAMVCQFANKKIFHFKRK